MACRLEKWIEITEYAKLHKSRPRLWKRKLITLNDAGVGRKDCRRRRESGQPRKRPFQGYVKSTVLLKQFSHMTQKRKLHRCVIPRHIFSHFFPQGYLDADILWLAGQPVLCCLDATLALSLWWQSSQLKQCFFSFTSDADLADVSDYKTVFSSFVWVCVVNHQPVILF